MHNQRAKWSLIVFFTFFSFPSFATPAIYSQIFANDDCSIESPVFESILKEVHNKTPGAVSDLTDCLLLNRKLMFQVALIDASQFQYAADVLREDENFVRRLIKVNPEVLKFAAPRLRSDEHFMKRATYVARDALQYADPKLLDDKIFMHMMIVIDYKNYIFASKRLRNIPEYARLALHDNGLYLEHAPDEIKDNKEMVKLAVESNARALEFASQRLKDDKELQALALRKTSIASKEVLEAFLEENYTTRSALKNVGHVIDHRMKFFDNHKIIDRNYITKWQKFFKHDNNHVKEQVRLIAADSRNYPTLWKHDFSEYPGVIDKIEEFFLSHQIDQNTVDNLSTTYLWKVKSDPLTLVFNVYLLRESEDVELGPDYANVNSLTAIVQKSNDKWRMTVVEVIFDSELKMDIAFKDGHKKYKLWDLYVTGDDDENPKIIFKSEDRFREFLEVYEEQNGGKYNMIYRTNLKKVLDNLD